MEERKSTPGGAVKMPVIPQWISVVAVITAATTGAVNSGAAPKGMYFLSVAGVVTIAMVLSWPVLHTAIDRVRAVRKRALVRRTFGPRVVALCRALRPLTEYNHQCSVGSVLGKSCGQNNNVFTASFENSNQLTLLLLFDRLEDIAKDAAGHPHETLQRLHLWWARYIQLYDTVQNEIRVLTRQGKIPPQFVESLLREWNHVHQRAGELRSLYLQLVLEISVIGDPHMVSPHLAVISTL